MTIKTTTVATCDAVTNHGGCKATLETFTTQPYLEACQAGWGVVHDEPSDLILTFCPVHKSPKKESNP